MLVALSNASIRPHLAAYPLEQKAFALQTEGIQVAKFGLHRLDDMISFAFRFTNLGMAASLAIAFAIAQAAFSEASEEQVSKNKATAQLPTTKEMIAARTDVWGDAAMREPNGPSYEFFKDLMPPLRWVNAEFRHYPIVLSAPRAAVKTRLVSNGSAINALANKKPMWHEQGVPISFFVGDPSKPFGEDLSKLQEPSYRDGYLPIVTMQYTVDGTTYQEEAFAPVDNSLAANGTSIVRFSLAKGSKAGRVEARVAAKGAVRVQTQNALDGKGKSLIAFSDRWRWESKNKALVADLRGDQTAEIEVFTQPTDSHPQLTPASYDRQKDDCIKLWNGILDAGVKLETPEHIVNDAWRSLVIGNLMIVVGDRPNYSAGNAYDHLYEAECGDTMRSLMMFGQMDVGPGMLKSMLEFNRKATQYHVAGQKLQLVSFFYWMTRDAATVRKLEPLWRQSVDLILKNRESASGLLPKDRYAGDIATQVYSLNSNANCWRGLRDLAAVLDAIGSKEESKKLLGEAADYRKAILRAVDRSERRETKPPYIPIALLADEPVPDPLTSTRFGSYYDLICPYIINSEIFGQGSEREDWLLGYLQNHGGIAMGMMRTEPKQGEFDGGSGCVPLYALRYQLALLRRDEREKALVGFYGQLAHGMTRGTFIGGEGCRFLLGADANGRGFYLPPNTTSNATWLIVLRNLLIQDWDLNEDGEPDTLRLLYAMPRPWLVDGAEIRMKDAPTYFGRVSVEAISKLKEGHVEVRVSPPDRPVKTMLVRAPVPAGWHVDAAEVNGEVAKLIDGNCVDLSGRSKPIAVRFRVQSR